MTIKKKGFFIVKSLISDDFLNEILKEIINIKDASFFYDKNKILRRIEKIYNRGKKLKELNKIIVRFLLNIFNKEFYIFKDKYNAKPPGGSGFFPHLDGVFEFKNKENEIKKGWYEYGDFFVNVLVALDDCNEKNGTIEIADKYSTNDFDELLNYTKKNGTPELNSISAKKTIFEKIILNKGDVVFFSNTCPHKSEKNNSDLHRRTLYYTYLTKNFGFQYENYFDDKKKTLNKTSKSLDE